MTDWVGYAAGVGVIVVALLFLARASQEVFEGIRSNEFSASEERRVGGRDSVDEWEWAGTEVPDGPESPPDLPVNPSEGGFGGSQPGVELGTRPLLLNVLVSHGLFAVALVSVTWYFDVPFAALGISAETTSARFVLLGAGAGIGLYGLNLAGSIIGQRVGVRSDESLRTALAPGSMLDWLILGGFVLPLVAGVEELLFRGALVGAFATGFGIAPWILAVPSSVAFALGHGTQGRVGIIASGLLGFLLAAVFITTGSLLVVIVAHYVVNALEFLVHEGLGWDPAE